MTTKVSTISFLFLSLLIAIGTSTTSRVFVDGFAAASKKKGGGGGGGNKKKKSSQAASTNRGFAPPPPTYEEVLKGFKTRLSSEDDEQKSCPCGLSSSKNTYRECCQPYHLGLKECLHPTEVLQSRYTAFYFRFIDHIIKTTHPNCRDFQEDKISWAKDLNKNGMFDSFDFVNLKILPFDEENEVEFVNDDEAYIEFEVTLRGREGATNANAVAGEETVVKERSQFSRDADSGIWTYSGGVVRSKVSGLEDTTLNV